MRESKDPRWHLNKYIPVRAFQGIIKISEDVTLKSCFVTYIFLGQLVVYAKK